MAAPVKLTYFNARGRCEGIRYTLKAGNVAFQDIRINQDEWASLKPETIMGSLPQMEVKGIKVGQSLAVGRLAAKLAGLYGFNQEEQGRVDMIVDTANDIRETLIKIKTDGAVEDDRAQRMAGVNTQLQNLNKILGHTAYFCGDQITWADIHFFHCLEFGILRMCEHNMLDATPKLKELYNRVAEYPQIKQYRRDRPQTKF